MASIQKLKLIASVALAFLAAGIGSYFTTSNIPTWYASLNKPFFSPPNWLFGPVWSLLYLFMGISLYLIWVSDSPQIQKKKAVLMYFIQLTLNVLWSVIFFGMRSPSVAIIEIIILEITIILTILQFKQISTKAARLLIPYALWVAFATILNLSIVVIN